MKQTLTLTEAVSHEVVNISNMLCHHNLNIADSVHPISEYYLMGVEKFYLTIKYIITHST